LEQTPIRKNQVKYGTVKSTWQPLNYHVIQCVSL